MPPTGAPDPRQINHSYLYSTTANDGKLWSRQDNVSGEVVEYQYDSIHRLTSAATTAGTAWSQSFVYDGFGNMKQKIGTGLAVGTSFNISLNSAKNGGGTGDPGDIDNRIVTGPTGETYSYAPDNKRIAKTLMGGAGTQWFLWVGGMRIGTYTHNWNAGTSQWGLASSKEDWYVADRRVAPSDRLGSDLTSGLKLMPYGEEIQPPNVPNDKTKFATYHRDASGLDYADQRYYSPGTGRFMSSDPYLASGGASSPSSWNRFAYVEGDPVNRIDSTGLMAASLVYDGGFGCVPVAYMSATASVGGDALSMCGAGFAVEWSRGMSTPSRLGEIHDMFDSARSLLQDWDYANKYGTAFNLSFNAGIQDIAIGVCIAQPELCLATAGALTIYVTWRHLPALLEAIRRGTTARQNAPVTYTAYQSTRDENGDCPPPDSEKFVKWRGTDHDHWHWVTWNTREEDCTHFPDYKTTVEDPGPKYREVAR